MRRPSLTAAVRAEENTGVAARRGSLRFEALAHLKDADVVNDRVKLHSRNYWSSSADLLHGQNHSATGKTLTHGADSDLDRTSVSDVSDTAARSRRLCCSLAHEIREPTSRLSVAWEVASISFLLYLAIALPPRLAFESGSELWHWSSSQFVFDFVMDIFFMLDIVRNFLVQYRDSFGQQARTRLPVPAHTPCPTAPRPRAS